MKKILLIDDEPDNLAVLAEMLRGQFHSIAASTAKDGISSAVRERPDLILLDVNMPEMDGYEVCRKLREFPTTRPIPIIMLTVESGLDQRVRGLEIGADDFISKPFQVRELLARINARIRRLNIQEQTDDQLILGNLKLDPKSLQIWVQGENIKLTRIEFELLRYFMERPNQVVDRTRLLGDLWPDAVVTHRTVDTHIANLRKKIRPIRTLSTRPSPLWAQRRPSFELGRKDWVHVLPRVTKAISQFIAPVSSSSSTPQPHRDPQKQGGGAFKRLFKKETPEEKPRPELKVIPGGEPAASPPAVIPSTPPEHAGVAHAFIQLFSTLQKKKGAILQWFGHRTYQTTMRENKKVGRFRKGAMLDRKAE